MTQKNRPIDLKKPAQVRQGDVFIFPCTDDHEIEYEVPQEDGATVLAHGEVTGHRHRFEGKGTALLQPADTEDRVLSIDFPIARLLHEEHGPIGLPGGGGIKYKVRIQRQWTHLGVRRVED